MLSEVEWLTEELRRLLEEEFNDRWIVGRLHELADYCRRGSFATQQVKAFAEFLSPGFSAQVHCAAAGCIRLLLPPGEVPVALPNVESTPAWSEDSQRRFRELVRLKATARISTADKEELDRLADLRRKTVAQMPTEEAKLHEQRLDSLRKVLGALDDYVRSFDTTNSPRTGT